MTKQPINSLKQPQMTSNSLKWPQAASNDLKQPQNKPQNYVWGQYWWLLSNFLVKKMWIIHFVAFHGLNWPQLTSKSTPTASRLSLRWQYFWIIPFYTKYESFKSSGTPSNRICNISLWKIHNLGLSNWIWAAK